MEGKLDGADCVGYDKHLVVAHVLALLLIGTRCTSGL